MTSSPEIQQSVPLCHKASCPEKNSPGNKAPSPEKSSSDHISPSREKSSSDNVSSSSEKNSSEYVSSSLEKSSSNHTSPLPQGDISIYISSKKRLPSGFGSIRYLGKGRRNAYAVHPPAKTVPDKKWPRPPALCYVPDWITGFKALSLYHAGLFDRGLERDLVSLQSRFSEMLAGLGMTAQEYPTGDILLIGKKTGLCRTGAGEEIREEIREETADAETSGAVLTFLGVLLQARNAVNNAPGSHHEPQAIYPDTDLPIDPDPDGSCTVSCPPGGRLSPEDNGANPDREKSYGDLLRSMLLSFGQILKKMKQSENDPGTDQSDDNTINDILQRCMLQGVEMLKDLSPENSHTEDYYAETDMQGMVQDENLTLSDMQRTSPIGKKGIPENSLAGKEEILENGLAGKKKIPENGLTVKKDIPENSLAGKAHIPEKRVTGKESASGNIFAGKDALTVEALPPLKDVYRVFYDFKYGPGAAKHLSHSSRCAAAAASRKLAPLFDRTMDEISIMDLQNLVNRTAEAGYSRSAVTDLVTLIRQIYRFAYPRELCSREYGKYVVMPSTVEETHHQDFTDEELRILWKHREDPVINMSLIMCYSGFRIGEFDPANEMKTVISEDGRTGYFQGGMKTRAGKNRIVPIHSAILPLVKKILNRQGQPVFFCGKSKDRFRDDMKTVLTRIGIDTVTRRDTLINLQTDVVRENRYHTPHSCRHTFSRLCESYGVNEADRRRMLGHSFGNDVTNGVYGHRTVRELAIEIEKIKVPK